MKIIKLTDKVKVKIHDVEVEISPLSFNQKTEVQSYMLKAAKGDIEQGMEGAKLAIKYALKSVSGIEDSNGNKYELELDNNIVSDECIEDLLNSEMSNQLTLICIGLLQGIPTEFIDPSTGKAIEGVSIKKNRTQKKKK